MVDRLVNALVMSILAFLITVGIIQSHISNYPKSYSFDKRLFHVAHFNLTQWVVL
jgi:hypothetical protein